MHGRLKVRTDVEKAARQFRQRYSTAIQMRNDGNKSDEALATTAKLLTNNPDVYTLWNYRREILLDRRSKALEESKPVKFDVLCINELDLVIECLLKNPKSYSCWHHRSWLIRNMFNPDIESEIALCDNALVRDSRNFPCWDYRRFVFRFANLNIKQELEFTKKKIDENFSNFSSWYRRSCLMTEASEKGIFNMSELWNEEYSLVENAIFTDPTDQSSWFYHKWLASTNFGNSLRSSSSDFRNRELQIVQIVVSPNVLSIRFNQATEKCPTIQVKTVDGTFKNESDFLVCSSTPSAQDIWFLKGNFNSNVEVSFSNVTIPVSLQDDNSVMVKLRKLFFDSSNQDRQLTEEHLKNLKELHELEPSNKWINLAMSHLVDDKIPILERLCQLDPLRKSYYLDHRSRLIVENELKTLTTNSLSLELRNRGLTRLSSFENLVHVQCLDLTGNDLTTIGRSFNYLVCLKVLVLDENKIERLACGLQLVNLRILSLKSNRIKSSNELFKLDDCIDVEKIYVFGNPFVTSENSEKLAKCPLFVVDDVSVDFHNVTQKNTSVKIEEL